MIYTYASHLAKKLMAVRDRNDALSIAEVVGGAGEKDNVVYCGLVMLRQFV